LNMFTQRDAFHKIFVPKGAPFETLAATAAQPLRRSPLAPTSRQQSMGQGAMTDLKSPGWPRSPGEARGALQLHTYNTRGLGVNGATCVWKRRRMAAACCRSALMHASRHPPRGTPRNHAGRTGRRDPSAPGALLFLPLHGRAMAAITL
jgi:hypothetical protein